MGVGEALDALERDRHGSDKVLLNVTSLRRALRDLADEVEESDAHTFWACEGPSEGLVGMKTCSICYAILALRGELPEEDG